MLWTVLSRRSGSVSAKPQGNKTVVTRDDDYTFQLHRLLGTSANTSQYFHTRKTPSTKTYDEPLLFVTS